MLISQNVLLRGTTGHVLSQASVNNNKKKKKKKKKKKNIYKAP